MAKPERIVYLPDIHVPFNINLAPIFRFIQDFKPHKVILGGDTHDWTAACNFIADQSRHLNGQIIKANYEELKREVLDPIRSITKAEIIWTLGNHEDWLLQAIAINPNGKGYWEIENNLDLKYYRLTILPLNIPYKASEHLYYMHGLYTNDHHAKKTALVYQKSVIYGHVHDIQEFTIVSPLDVTNVIKAKSVGCLCRRNPRYMRNKPNKWVNGFNYAYMDQGTGHFNEYTVNIIDGGFFWNGKKYSS